MWACASIAWMLAAGAPEAGPVRVDLEHGFYLIARPEGIDDEALPPLVICLHGTDTTAAGILEYWRSFDHTLPMVLVAPQAIHAGWRDTNLVLINEFLNHLARTVRYDPRRVLLTGHSAGGAMTFHLLYVECFPATAAAVTANYVPPTVKAEDVRARNAVPVFYGVGESDINRDRMRDGLALLRGNGVSVTVQRPDIGHVLDRSLGQAAMSWFEGLCRADVERTLLDARQAIQDDGWPSGVACALEEVIRRRATQFPDQVTRAMELLAELQQPGRQALSRAARLLEENRPMDARAEILVVEQRYRPSSLAEEAQRRRLKIEAQPEVADLLRLERAMGQPDGIRPAAEPPRRGH